MNQFPVDSLPLQQNTPLAQVLPYVKLLCNQSTPGWSIPAGYFHLERSTRSSRLTGRKSLKIIQDFNNSTAFCSCGSSSSFSLPSLSFAGSRSFFPSFGSGLGAAGFSCRGEGWGEVPGSRSVLSRSRSRSGGGAVRFPFTAISAVIKTPWILPPLGVEYFAVVRGRAHPPPTGRRGWA